MNIISTLRAGLNVRLLYRSSTGPTRRPTRDGAARLARGGHAGRSRIRSGVALVSAPGVTVSLSEGRPLLPYLFASSMVGRYE